LRASSVVDSGDTTHARQIIETLRIEADRIGEENTAAHAVALEADVTLAEGDLEGALSLNTEAVERLLAAGDPRFQSTVLIGIEVLSNLGHYQEAEALIARLVSESAHFPGGPVEDWVTAALRGRIAIYQGDYAEAVELFESCIEPARRIGSFDLGEILCQLAVAEFGRGNNDTAHRLIHQARPLLPELIPITSYAHRVPIIAALIDLHHQGVKAAVPHLRNALDVAGVVHHEAVLTVVAEAALEANQPTETAILLGAAEAARQHIHGLVPEHWVRQSRQRSMEHLRRTLNAGDLEQLHNQGKKHSYQQAAQRARTLLTIVEESDSSGRPDQSIPEQ
jgi:tetratricopeptide (TPR) repeat protein